MNIHKVMCCCGSGLGSSLMVSMNAEEVIKKMGFEDIEVVHSSLSDCVPGSADLFIVGGNLRDFVSDIPDEQKVVLDNIIDKDELETKLRERLLG